MKFYLNRFDLKLDEAQLKSLGEGKPAQTWVQIFRPGAWKHPRYGPLKFTNETFEGFVKNFKDKVRKIELAIDQSHQPEKGAAAWFKDVQNRGDAGEDQGLWALVEWTKWGLQLVADGVFKYLSGDFDYEWKDEESGKKFKNVLFGAALTNRPFIKGMSPINLSEYRDDLEKDEDIRNTFKLAEDVLKLKEEGAVKTDAEIMAVVNEADLSPEELARKKVIAKEKADADAVALGKKKLTERAKAIGLADDASEEDVKKKEKELADEEKKKEEDLKARAVAVGLADTATVEDIEKAEKAKKEKTLAEIKITPENEQRVKMAVALGLSADASIEEISAAATKAIAAARKIEGSGRTMSEAEVTTLLASGLPVLEKKLSEMKESAADAFTIKLLEETIDSKKKLYEAQFKSAKEKIEMKLKEHWREGKLTSRERDIFQAILLCEAESGEETSYKLSEKDKEGKDIEATKTLGEVLDMILTERPALIELKELARKEIEEPPKDKSEEEEDEEAKKIAARVAGNVTGATKTAKKLAEEIKKNKD